MRLRFRRSQSSPLRKQKKKGDITSYLDTIEDKEILRLVQDIRRRNGLPDVPSKSMVSSSSLTAQFTSSTGTSSTTVDEQLDERKQLSKLSFMRRKFARQKAVKETPKPEQLREEVYSAGSAALPNEDKEQDAITPPRVTSSRQSLRTKIKNRIPLSIDTLLDSSDDSDGSVSHDGDITNCETHSNDATSPRTPRSAQLFSFVCSPVLDCNDKIDKLSTAGIGPTNTSSESEASNDDESKSWLTVSTAPDSVARPSLLKSVYDQVVGDFEGGISHNDTMVAATVFDRENDTLYPMSFIEPPPSPRLVKARKQEKKKQTKGKLKYDFEKSDSILDDESYVEKYTTFPSLTETMLTEET